jgi:hypothetical protein
MATPDPISLGPFTWERVHKLRKRFVEDLQRRLNIAQVDALIVDSIMVDYLLHNGTPPSPLTKDPALLAAEWSFFTKKMHYELSTPIVTEPQIREMHERFEPPDVTRICFCHEPVGAVNGDVVRCAHKDCTIVRFHVDCLNWYGVQPLGPLWFCNACERRMVDLVKSDEKLFPPPEEKEQI